MKRISLFLIAAVAAVSQLMASYTPQEAVNKFVSHSSLRYASVGVQVIDLDSAKSIASYRPEQANITASTMKQGQYRHPWTWRPDDRLGVPAQSA